MNMKKFIFGALGIGAIGGLTFFFSKKAEAAALNAQQTQTGTYNPLAVAARAGRLITAQEINDFIEIWGVGPEELQCIENWDCHLIQQDPTPVPNEAEARIRLPDLLSSRGITWTYVSDFYARLPQFNPAVETVITRPGRFAGGIDVTSGVQSNEPAEGIPLNGPLTSMRRLIGKSRFDSTGFRGEQMKAAQRKRVEMYRDLYCIMKYGWDRWGNPANGKATLIGLGGITGFQALWQPVSITARASMAPIRRAQWSALWARIL